MVHCKLNCAENQKVTKKSFRTPLLAYLKLEIEVGNIVKFDSLKSERIFQLNDVSNCFFQLHACLFPALYGLILKMNVKFHYDRYRAQKLASILNVEK